MNNEWAASTAFIAVDAHGTRNPISVHVGIPYQVDTAEWACPVLIDGPDPMLRTRVSAGDALQALGLAWVLTAHTLLGFEARGGHIEFATGGPVPLAAYFSHLQFKQ